MTKEALSLLVDSPTIRRTLSFVIFSKLSVLSLSAAVLTGTFLSFSSALGQEDLISKERAKVASECRQLARPLGLSNSRMEDAAKRATTLAELSDISQECKNEMLAYPSQTLDEPAIARGSLLYTSLGCRVCHGSDARGGESGPSLLRSQRLLNDKKGEVIGEVLRKGIPNTRMVAFDLTDQQIYDVAAFLHGLQVKHLEKIRGDSQLVDIGDARAGEVYFSRKCSQCHSVAGDLAGIGGKYPDNRALQQKWVMPNDEQAKSAIVTSRAGTVLEGNALQIDEFSLSLRLRDGTRRTLDLDGKNWTTTIRDRLASHRSLLGDYSDVDIHDVTAYLRTLVQPPGRDTAGDPLLKQTEPFPTLKQKPVVNATLGRPTASDHHMESTNWPTYSGDYSGRRYSLLSQINRSNVRSLTLAWTTRLTADSGSQGSYPVKLGGEGKDDQLAKAPAEIRGSVLEVHGVLYLSTPDNAWAVDAHNGEILWNFRWRSRGGWHLFGSRGPAMRGSSVYFETPDDYLVSLDAETGDERWHAQIASVDEQYFASVAPMVVDNHVLVGTGNTLNAPGFLESFDPDTGQLQWKHYSVPMETGDLGIETWKDLDAARHGGGQVWVPGAYDPKNRLYIYGTGNPTPAYTADVRGDGDALFTCSLLAVNIDSGKLVWYYQTSPNDTHDWDSAQTPVLADIIWEGRKREVAMTAARNGYFFVVDRNSGALLLTKKFSSTMNWARADLNPLGQPVRLPGKDGLPNGALVSNDNGGATNWQPPSYSPDYGLFYVQSAESWALSYKTDSDAGGAYSMEGKEEISIDSIAYLKAIKPKSGRVVWSIKYPSGHSPANGILTTAGRLLFAGDTAGNLVARDPANGQPLWHVQLHGVSNAPETYLLDGKQFVLVASGNALYAFRLQ